MLDYFDDDELVVRGTNWMNIKVSYEDIEEKLIPLCGDRSNAFILYLKMRSRIVREGWKDHPHYPIKRDFYDKGKLAMTMSTRQMAEEFNMDRRTIHRYMKQLHEFGWIKFEALKIPGKPKPQYVYVFGTWRSVEGKIEENFFNSNF